MTSSQSHLVRLCGLMEHPGIDGCCHQVIGCCDGMNVTSQMEVELKTQYSHKKKIKRGEGLRYRKSKRYYCNAVVHTVTLDGPGGYETSIRNLPMSPRFLEIL